MIKALIVTAIVIAGVVLLSAANAQSAACLTKTEAQYHQSIRTEVVALPDHVFKLSQTALDKILAFANKNMTDQGSTSHWTADGSFVGLYRDGSIRFAMFLDKCLLKDSDTALSAQRWAGIMALLEIAPTELLPQELLPLEKEGNDI